MKALHVFYGALVGFAITGVLALVLLITYNQGWNHGFDTASQGATTPSSPAPKLVQTKTVTKTAYVQICDVTTSIFHEDEIGTTIGYWDGSLKKLIHQPAVGSMWLVRYESIVYGNDTASPATIERFISQENPNHLPLKGCRQTPSPNPGPVG